jgi:hypothetical protein
METAKDQNEVSVKLEEATKVLKVLDDQAKSEIKRHQLEDPSYAEERGMEVVHFAVKDNHNSRKGQWMMISQPWGEKAKSLVEYDKTKLPWVSKYQLEKFTRDSDTVSSFYFRRRKSTVERQPGAVKVNLETGEYVANLAMKRLWTAIFVCCFVFLFLFFGVGVIATNSPFSPLFQKIFFWVAVIWTMAPTILLSWLVSAIGGSKRDIASVFLASLAIWLVVIQIGQTHLITFNNNNNNNNGTST